MKFKILQGLVAIFAPNKKNIYKSPAHKHWAELPGNKDSKKLSFLLSKYSLKQKEFAILLGVSTALMNRIIRDDLVAGNKIISSIYEYEQNPQKLVYHCKSCGEEFDRKGKREICDACKYPSRNNEYKSLVYEYWGNLPGDSNSKKLSLLLDKFSIKQRDFSIMIGMSETLVCKILRENRTPGYKFIAKVYEYEQNPQKPVYHCKSCGEVYDRKGSEGFCRDCKKPQNRQAMFFSFMK